MDDELTLTNWMLGFPFRTVVGNPHANPIHGYEIPITGKCDEEDIDLCVGTLRAGGCLVLVSHDKRARDRVKATILGVFNADAT